MVLMRVLQQSAKYTAFTNSNVLTLFYVFPFGKTFHSALHRVNQSSNQYLLSALILVTVGVRKKEKPVSTLKRL